MDLDGVATRRSARGDDVSLPATQGLELEDARILLPLLDPELRVAFAQALPARAGREHAHRWPDPTLNVDVANAFSGGVPDEIDAFLQFPLALAGQQEALADQFDAEDRLAVARAEAVVFERTRALERTWIEWSRALQVVRINGDLARALDAPLARVDALEASGSLDRVERGLFQLARVDAVRRERGGRERAADLELEIRHALGLRAGAYPPLVPVALSPPESGPAGALDRALPSLAAARAGLELAEAAVHVAHRARFVQPQLGVGAGQEDGGSRVLFGLQIPIPLWNRGLGRLARAVAERELAAQRFELAYERALEREERARRRVRSAQNRRLAIEEELIPLAREQVQTLEQLLVLGDLRPFMLVQAMERRQSATLDRLELLAEELAASMELRSLLTDEDEQPTAPTQERDERGGGQ